MRMDKNARQMLGKVLAALMVLAMALFVLGVFPGGSGGSNEVDVPETAEVIAATEEPRASEEPASPAEIEAPQAEDDETDTRPAESASSSDDSEGTSSGQSPGDDAEASVHVSEDGEYSSKDEVAAYLHLYGHLPANFVSKTKAKKAGWVSSKGNLWDVLPGMSIGGSIFYNDEGSLPDAPGREWHECDINYQGGYRGSERIVWSNDGLIYYTGNHYETFELLYGEP